MAPKYSSLSEIQALLLDDSLNCLQLVEHYLSNIERTKALNAYVEVFEDEIIQQAKEIDQQIGRDKKLPKPLTGLIFSIKDVLCYKGKGVTASSKILSGFESLYTATSVQRLLDAGALVIGRTNCDEFAMGSSNENSFYGPVGNALDPERTPGGSSGGAAVSVQTDTCLIGLGSDTGGSVRQPAALCGIVGLKPTYGRISRYGLLAYASSFDQIGIFAHSTENIAHTLEHMAGVDEFDSTSSQSAVPSYSKHLDFDKNQNLSLAYVKTAVEHPSIDPAVKENFNKVLTHLEQLGHQITAVDINLLDYLIPTYYVLTTAEASSNLARYDGIRYGRRSTEAANLEETYTKSRSEGFGAEVKRRIMLGTFVLSSGYYDAFYSKAQKVRKLITEETNAILNQHDYMLLPTAPTGAFKLGEKTQDPVSMYLSDIFTVQGNLVGLPGISLPMGTDVDNFPIGFQILGRKFEEQSLLAFSKYIQSIMPNVV